jgi:gliding motility-associated-like protein
MVSNLGGCKDTIYKDSIIVVAGPIGTFAFSPVSGCNPLKAIFKANSANALNYIWDFGDGNVINGPDSIVHIYTSVHSNATFNPVLILGNTLSNNTQCLLPATNQTGLIHIVNTVSVNVSPNLLILPEDSFAFVNPIVAGGTAPYQYHWSPIQNISCTNCATPIVIKGTGDNVTYLFTVTDAFGCESNDSVVVKSKMCLDGELIPNVFSPNGDGVNDVFVLPKICSGTDYSLQIFDRWGLVIYDTFLRNNSWDGKTSQGEEAPTGTYFVIIKVNGKSFKQFIHLFR